MLLRKTHSRPFTGSVAEISAQMLTEIPFRKMLSLERKRSERSGRLFALMLLDCRKLRVDDRAPALTTVAAALVASTRETDVKGWHEAGAVIGVIFTELGPADAKSITTALLNRVKTVISAALGARQLENIEVSLHIFPDSSGEGSSGGLVNPHLYPEIAARRNGEQASRAIKRIVDIGGSVFALVLLSPFLVAIAVIVKLTSPGPVLFRQQRVGQHGIPFTFLKFRSMYVASDSAIHQMYVKSLITGEANGNGTRSTDPVYKLTNDPRITPLGHILRRTSLDELPQLFNVLTGTMSLVGPRPPIPYEVECYDAWHKARLLAVKPGITGLWQIEGRSRTTFDEMVRLDLLYARTWSLWLDIRILLRTPAAVLSREGAY